MTDLLRVGPEFLVNTATAGAQMSAAVAALSGGGFVVTWNDDSLGAGGAGGDASSTAVKGQLFTATGARSGDEFLVNTTTSGKQFEPAVTALQGGGFLVTWSDLSGDGSNGGVKGQLFTAAGAKAGGEFLVNTATNLDQGQPAVTALSGGGFVVTWSDASQGVGGAGGDASNYAIKGQLFTAAGVRAGTEFLVNTTTSSVQYEPAVTALSGGGFVVTWSDLSRTGGDTDSTAVRGQLFTAAGAKSGAEFLVNTITLNGQDRSAVTGLAGGGFVVTWTGYSGTLGDVRGQLFTAAGVRSGAEFVVNTTTSNPQSDSAVTALPGGGFVVTWSDNSATGGDTSEYAVRGQVFTAAGAKSGAEFLVNTTTAGWQSESAVTALAGGGFVVAWTDQSATGGDTSGNAVRAQLFRLNDAPSAPALVGAAGAVVEGATAGAAVLTAAVSDPDGDALTYSLDDDAGGRFAIDASTGVVTVANASLLNFEAASSHAITVRASDGLGGTSTAGFTIAVTNAAPSAPTDASGALNQVFEGAANGTLVGITAAATDPGGGTVTYSLADNAGGRFAVDASTGVVTVANAALLNFEGATSHAITLRASDAAGAFADTSFTVAVLNAPPSAPTDADARANAVFEGAATGTQVGITGAAADPNGGVVTYALADSAGGRFAVDASTGVVTVANGSLIDFDTAPAHLYQLTLRASDAAGAFTDTAFTISALNAAPLAPADANGAANLVSEGAAAGTLVGITALAADPGGGAVTYSLTDDAGGRFSIDAGSGVVRVANGVGLDFEGAAAHALTVRASDASGLFREATFSVGVVDVLNEVLTGTGGADTLRGGAGDDTFFGAGGDDLLFGGGGRDELDGGFGDDALYGGDGNDTLTGGGGRDRLSGGEGFDTLLASGTEGCVLDGGAGDDTLFGGSGRDQLFGGDGGDRLLAGGAGSLLDGGAGDDFLIGGGGNDTIFGGEGSDAAFGGAGDDYLQADGGASSVLAGEDGNDTIYGGAGNDYLVGGAGDDVLVGLGGTDSLYGGDGADYLVAGDGAGSVVDGGAGANSLWGASGNDYMVGGEGNDIVVGAGGSDYLFGNAGNDGMYGGGGTDYIFGNAGNEFIYTDDFGTSATDYVYAGGGTGVDTVADFTAGAGGDVLVISPASGIGSFAQAQAAMSQVGVYTVLTMSGGDAVYLYNVQPFQLTANNFLFF